MSDAATAFAVLEWLEAKSADYPGLTDAMPSIEAAFSVGLRSPTDFQKYSIYPISLNETLASGNKTLDNLPAGAALNIVESDDKFQPFKETVTKKGYFANEDKSSDLDSDSLEYAKRQAKLVRKFKEKSSKNWHSLSGVSNSNNSDSHSAAEDKKALGNTALQGKDYELAIQLYTEAIEMSPDGPTSHVYYSNRAAAYCHKSEYELAVADCQTCISLEPSFTRAYARMGLANFYLKRYEDRYVSLSFLSPLLSCYCHSDDDDCTNMTTSFPYIQPYTDLFLTSPPFFTMIMILYSTITSSQCCRLRKGHRARAHQRRTRKGA